MQTLPKGLFYEEGRGRFRVRLYHEKRVFHLSYHYSYEEAITTLEATKDIKLSYKKIDRAEIRADSVKALTQSTRNRLRKKNLWA